jgi:hypothetical protein
MTNHARKMLEWGDKCVGFQQQHEVAGWVQPTAAVRFYLGAADSVEIAFSTTIAFGGGVQHSADGSIVLSRAHAAELGAVLLGREDPIATLNPADIDRIRDQVLDKSKNALFRSGVKIAAAEIQKELGAVPRLEMTAYLRDALVRWSNAQGFDGETKRAAEKHLLVQIATDCKLQQSDQLREILASRPGEGADEGKRIFARLTGETASDGVTLIADEVSRNFAASPASTPEAAPSITLTARQAAFAAYPESDSPHTSVKLRVVDERKAFYQGYLAGAAMRATQQEDE